MDFLRHIPETDQTGLVFRGDFPKVL